MGEQRQQLRVPDAIRATQVAFLHPHGLLQLFFPKGTDCPSSGRAITPALFLLLCGSNAQQPSSEVDVL